MRKYLALALLLIAATTQSQINLLGQTTKEQESNFYVTSSLLFVSGMADGLAEASKFHPKGVTEVFGNPQFWDNSLSWRNKYRNGDPAKGAKFPLSTTALAWTTDGYHLSRMIRNSTMIAAITIRIGESAKDWYQYVIEAVIYYLTYQLGFTITYDIIFKQ